MRYTRTQGKKRGATPVGESCSRCGKRLTKMQLVLLSVLLYSSLTTGAALKILRMEGPSIADPRWESLSLRCVYDLKNKDLYSVKWYKDGIEFFRFMPESKPAGRDYHVDGVHVDVSRSDSHQVTLRGQAYNKGNVNLMGTYGCEVSSEGPSFLTDYAEVNMSVAVLPKSPPALDGVQPSYKIGEKLDAECKSESSYPPAVLTFILNGKEVDRTFTKNLTASDYVEGDVPSTTRLGLTLRLERHNFPGGGFSLTCQAALPEIAEVLKTTKTASLAASNQPLAQEQSKSGSSRSYIESRSSLIRWTIAAIHLVRCRKLRLFGV